MQITKDIEINKTSQEELDYLIKHIRKEDKEELQYIKDKPIEEILYLREDSKTLIIKGNIICIFGISEYDMLYPYMISTKHILEHKKQFLKISKEIWGILLENCPNKPILNFVYNENRLAIKWLKWLGFTVEKPVKMFYANKLFRRFYV